MIAGLLRFLLLLLAARFVLRLLISLSKTPSISRGNAGTSGGQLVRDPVCGVYILKDRSVEESGEHFCSPACQIAFREKREVGA